MASPAANILSMTMSEVSQSYRSKALSVLQVLDKVIAQQDVMATLNAFISVTSTEKLKKLAAASQKRYDDGTPLSKIDGVPIIVKDNYCTSWAPTTCASKMLSHYTPPYDATLVTKLVNAGALIVGKANMDEFAMGSAGMNSVYGPSKNIFGSPLPYSIEGLESVSPLPADDWLVTGGSSGGSAVAVVAGMAFGGLGSDTGGSVRNPASLCGVVGFKPSYGLLSRHGLISLVNSLDSPGLLTRDCEDCAVLLELLAYRDCNDSTSLQEDSSPSIPPMDELVVGVPKEFHCQGLHPSVLEKWREVEHKLREQGAKMVSVSMPHIPSSPSCYSVLNNTEVASNFTRYTGTFYGHKVPCDHSMEAQYALTRASGLSQVVRDRVLAGNYFLLNNNKEKYLYTAMKVRRLISNDFLKVFSEGVDVLLTPTTLFPATKPDLFRVKNFSELTYLQDLCTSPANLAGVPALSIPVGYTVPLDGAEGDTVRNEGQIGAGEDYSGEYWSTQEGIGDLPLSLQLMGPRGSDRRLVGIGKMVEKLLGVPKVKLKDPL